MRCGMHYVMRICFALLLLLLASVRAQNIPCGPAPAIGAQLEKTIVVLSGPSDFDSSLRPLLALRDRYPQDLWVNERYQDAVQQYGIEGHLRKLTEEYQVLSMQHPDEVIYSYLYARSLMGRNTASALEQLTGIIAGHPDFAPAYGSMAEIHVADAFRDDSKAQTERARFLALCPQASAHGFGLQPRPAALPRPSPLIDQAEALLAQHGDPERIAAMADQGIRADEWRLQHIRPFDWYSVEYKRQAQRELQAKYWRVWSLQVRCQRLSGRTEKAGDLLAAMEQRAASLHKASDPAFWDALTMLVRLYAEGNQEPLAARKLDAMQEFLAVHPDSGRSAQLEDFRRLVNPGAD